MKGRWRNNIKPEWFGAIPDGKTDCVVAFNCCINSGLPIELSNGHYKFYSGIKVNKMSNIMIWGTGAVITKEGDKNINRCILDFDDIPNNQNGIEFSFFQSLTIKDVYISFNKKKSPSNYAALKLSNGSNFLLDGICIDSYGGQNSKGIVLGDEAKRLSVFNGVIHRCKVISNKGIGIYSGVGNTSLNFNTCYLIGGNYEIKGTVYSSFLNCACDASRLPSYHITGDMYFNSTNLTFISCGAEGGMSSAFLLDNYSQNISMINPYGNNDNILGYSNIGSLITISAKEEFVKNINIDNPTSLDNNSSQSIFIDGNKAKNILILGLNETLLKNGIKGELRGVMFQGDSDKK